MENNKWDHGVNREYMGVCVQLRGALNIRGRDVDLILHAKLLQLCQTLCEPMDCSPPGSSVHGTLQARILEWVAISFSRRSSQPRDQTCIPYVSGIGRQVHFHWRHLGSFSFMGGRELISGVTWSHLGSSHPPQFLWGVGFGSVFLYTVLTGYAAAAKSLQSCLTLCNPIDGSPPGSPVLGILQARTLEWVAISFSNAWNWKVKVMSLSHVQLLATPWTAACQAPPSMGFSRQEYWSGVPLPSPTGYEEGLNVLSLWCIYEYHKRRAPFKLPSKNNPLFILRWRYFNKTHFQFTCVLFILSGQTPSSDCLTSWPQTQESMKFWWTAENTCWESSLCLMDSRTYGHVHHCICNCILVIGLFFCLGIYHLTVLSSLLLEGWIC